MNFFHSNLIEWIHLDVKCSIKWESNMYAMERILGIGLPHLWNWRNKEKHQEKKFRLEDYRMAQAAGSIISYEHSSRFGLSGICLKRDMG